MKRGRLSRHAELKPDPEKVRAFMQRGRKPLPRGRRTKTPEGPLTPAEWRVAVWKASGGRCIITGSIARDSDDPDFDAHHAVPKQALRRRGLFGHVWDPRNGVWIRADVHERHENASRRIPHTALPPSVWEFAGALDALEGSLWASELVRRLHPVRGGRGLQP